MVRKTYLKEVIQYGTTLLLILLTFVTPCFARHHGCNVLIQKVAAVAVPVYTPIIVARVGDDLETQALVDKRVEERLQEAGLSKAPPAKTAPKGTAAVKPIAPGGLLANHCARCHNTPSNTRAYAAWDMKSLDGETGFNIINMVVNKKNVPTDMKAPIAAIKEAEMGTLLDELFALYNQVNPAKEQVAPDNTAIEQFGGF